jgi:SlyX protein
MSGEGVDARIVDLQTRVAFQEHALSELSDALAEARMENARLVLMVQRALDEVRQLRAGMAPDLTGDPASEPPPPHY